MPSALGPLRWKKLEKPPGFSLLIDEQDRPRLALPMYVWFRLLEEGWLLLWRKRPKANQAIIQRINLDDLKILTGMEQWAAQNPPSEAPLFSTPHEFISSFEVNLALEAGVHTIDLPSEAAHTPEFFVIADNPIIPTQPGAASCCIYAVDPQKRIIEVIPQDWFNNGGFDYGYQGITSVARDPATNRLIVGGIRIDVYILDETGRQVAERLPR